MTEGAVLFIATITFLAWLAVIEIAVYEMRGETLSRFLIRKSLTSMKWRIITTLFVGFILGVGLWLVQHLYVPCMWFGALCWLDI